jgi:hypothetical protein
MKKIINQRIYDTSTATEIASYRSPGRLGDDFDTVREVLYKTPHGRFFLLGKGFVAPWGADNLSGGTSCGADIQALDEAEARAWIERRHIDPVEIERVFEFEEA